jgi:hypothetical protein
MYRVYIRTHGQTVLHKTTTPSPAAAELAFRELMRKREFWATKTAAVLSLDGRQLEYRRFDRIVPADDVLAEKLRHGEDLPNLPRYIYPLDREALTDLHEPHILCYVKPVADAPFFDDDEPVRLYHE